MDKLGIDSKILLAQIINFVVLLVLFKKFVYKPFLTKLKDEDKKRKESEASLVSYRKKEEELMKLETKVKSEYDTKTKELYAQMKKEADKLKKEILDKAHKEAEDIRKRNLDLIEAEKEKSMAELKKEAYHISVTMLEKATMGAMSEDLQKKVNADVIKKLPKISA